MTTIPLPDTLGVVEARITRVTADERLAREVGDDESVKDCERLLDRLWLQWHRLHRG